MLPSGLTCCEMTVPTMVRLYRLPQPSLWDTSSGRRTLTSTRMPDGHFSSDSFPTVARWARWVLQTISSPGASGGVRQHSELLWDPANDLFVKPDGYQGLKECFAQIPIAVESGGC